MGYRFGVDEIQRHAWFADVNFSEIYKKQIKPPFVPGKEDNFDALYCNKPDEFDLKTYEHHLTRINNEKHFDEFYFDIDDCNINNKVNQDKIQKTFVLENVLIEMKNVQEEKYSDYTNKGSVFGHTNSHVFRVADTTLSLLNRQTLKEGQIPNKHKSNKELIQSVQESKEKEKRSTLGKSY